MPAREVPDADLTAARKETTLTYTARAMRVSSFLAVLAASALGMAESNADPIVLEARAQVRLFQRERRSLKNRPARSGLSGRGRKMRSPTLSVDH